MRRWPRFKVKAVPVRGGSSTTQSTQLFPRLLSLGVRFDIEDGDRLFRATVSTVHKDVKPRVEAFNATQAGHTGRLIIGMGIVLSSSILIMTYTGSLPCCCVLNFRHEEEVRNTSTE